MPDKPMIPSEATTAGAVRQSTDSAEQCPRCGAPREGRNPFLPSYGRYECGSYQRDDTATIECYRRQLAQANAHNAQLRAALEDLAERAERLRSALRETGLKIGLRPDQCNWGVLDTTEARVALADAPAPPYAAVVEAARQDYSSARTACEYRRVKGDCEAWTRRGRTCPDCPLEWFDALPEALGKLDEEADACDS